MVWVDVEEQTGRARLVRRIAPEIRTGRLPLWTDQRRTRSCASSSRLRVSNSLITAESGREVGRIRVETEPGVGARAAAETVGWQAPELGDPGNVDR
jgi:hypothetical protein